MAKSRISLQAISGVPTRSAAASATAVLTRVFAAVFVTLLAAAVALLGAGIFPAGALAAEKNSLTIGVTAGPHEEIMEVVKQILAKEGIAVKIVTFTDYVAPNLALSEGELDANSFQHLPYLEQFSKDRKLDLVSIGNTFIFPMGIYSRRIKSLDELKKGATVAIPNDPTNGGRALLLLQEAGVIKLRKGVGSKATVLDIADNPKNLKIVELDAAQLPRSLEDTDASAINTNYAIEAGLNPAKDAIFREGPKSPYVNIIAARAKDKDLPIFKKLLEAYHSEEVKQFVTTRFKGSVAVGWE